MLLLYCSSCVTDDDFNVPPINLEEPEVTANFTIAKVKEFYRGFEPVLIQAGTNSNTPLYVEAYVVSSDESGNFFRTLIVQDQPENPTSAIAISTDATDVYTLFEPGRKVYIRVDGLYSGAYAGLPTIGTRDVSGGRDVGRLSTSEFDARIIRSVTKENLVPKILNITDIEEKHLNMLISLSKTQFAEQELGASYANLTNTFGVNRSLVNCEGDSFVVRTSGYADFKNLALPEGNGTITGILGRFNTNFQLLIRDTKDVDFTGERCN